MRITRILACWAEVPVLLRGERQHLANWVKTMELERVLVLVGAMVLGSGLYGAAMGSWRGEGQMFCTGLKFPMILLLTSLGTALLNGMLAPLLGLNLGLRQSVLAVLMSFAIAALVLGGFSPLLLFLTWTVPPLTTGAAVPEFTYALLRLTHVLAIGFAGAAANLRLLQVLEQLAGDRRVARRVLGAWLLSNLLLGSQLVWILRPLIGSPHLPVQFLRANAFEGNFYETVFHAVLRILANP